MQHLISEEVYNEFNDNGYIIFKKAINEITINKSLKAIEDIREKCERYDYPYYRRYQDIAINDIYGIEHIFHPKIYNEHIFNSIKESKVLEISSELLKDEEIFLSRNRIHCTKNISHSGKWHRDGTPTGNADDIDDYLKKSEKEIMWIQATLPYYYEDGFYIIPGSHKYSKNFIPTKSIRGTKKILENEKRLILNPGDLLLFNPFLIHRGTCVGRKLKQRAHIHMRFARKKFSRYADRYIQDKDFFKNPVVYNNANNTWKKSIDLTLDDPIKWYGDEIIQKKPNLLSIRFYMKLLLILINRIIYNLSRFYPFSQRSLENINFIKYPFLK